MVEQSLRAGEHGVVVRHRDRRLPVDGAHAPDEPVGRRAFDQLLQRSAPALRRDHQGRVLHEAAGIQEVGDVLARRALAGRAPAGDRVGASTVEPDVVTPEHLGEVGANAFQVDRGVRDRLFPGRALARLHEQQRVAGHHGVAHRDRHTPHHAGGVGGDHVLHLHRLEHEELLADTHEVTLGHVDRHDGSLHRRRDRLHPDCLARAGQGPGMYSSPAIGPVRARSGAPQ